MRRNSAAGTWTGVHASAKGGQRRFGVSHTAVMFVLGGLALVYALSYGEFFRGSADRALWAAKVIFAGIGAVAVIANPTRRIITFSLLVMAASVALPRLLFPSVTSHDADLLIMIYVSILATTVSLDAVDVACAVGWIVGAAIVVSTSFLGLVPQRVVVTPDRVRHYWGFANPNGSGIVVFVAACCIYLLLRRHRGAPLVLIAGGIVVWFMSASRTPIVALGVAAGFDLIARSRLARSRYFSSSVVLVASLIGGVGLLVQMGSSLLLTRWPEIDILLSGRLTQWSTFVQMSGWRAALYGGAVGQFDGGYLQVYGAFGLLFFVVFMTDVLFGVGRLCKQGQWPVVCVIVGWLVFSGSENVLLAPGLFPAVLAWGVAVGRTDWIWT